MAHSDRFDGRKAALHYLERLSQYSEGPNETQNRKEVSSQTSLADLPNPAWQLMTIADALASLLSHPVCSNPIYTKQVGIQFRHMNSCYSGSYPMCICIEYNLHLHTVHFCASRYRRIYVYT